MAVRSNLGKVRSSLKEMKRTTDNLYKGPYLSPSDSEVEYDIPAADWMGSNEVSNDFIFGFDKWGSSIKKVAKG